MSIGISRKQRVFAILEDTTGTIKFPVAGSFIRPAGDAVINQSPDFVDSEEKQDTLDVLDRFQNAKPPGEFSIPMYLRLTASGASPQGNDIFTSLQGAAEEFAGDVVTEFSAVATIGEVGLMTGTWPQNGVITFPAGEKVLFSRCTTTSATQATIGGMVRGYESTSAIVQAVDNVITGGIFFKQETESPSLSIWVETDHFIQGLAGATVNSANFSVTNEGAVKVDISGQGMSMVWAGTTTKDANLKSTNASQATVTDARAFSVGSFIQCLNAGTPDHNTGAGYQITSSNATTNIIQFTPNSNAQWAAAATICGYLPEASAVGDAIESRYTSIELDGVSASLKNTELSVSTPKQYISDEVGTTYPEDYMEQVRDISSNLDIYFREDDFNYFKDGYDGNSVAVLIVFGTVQGKKLGAFMRNCSITVPTVGFSAPAVNLSMPIKALGENGEDSLELTLM